MGLGHPVCICVILTYKMYIHIYMCILKYTESAIGVRASRLYIHNTYMYIYLCVAYDIFEDMPIYIYRERDWDRVCVCV